MHHLRLRGLAKIMPDYRVACHGYPARLVALRARVPPGLARL
jgi:hypothetical protein